MRLVTSEVLASKIVRIAAVGLAAAALAEAPARAEESASCTLGIEFDHGIEGEFGHLRVVEDGSSLRFEIEIDPAALGTRADLHQVHFNLDGAAAGVHVETLGAMYTPFTLRAGGPTPGGAGAHFDYGVNLGNGSGRRGNGVLQSAAFRVHARTPLEVSALLPLSMTSRGILAHVAVHVQNTALVRGASSETLGCVLAPDGPSSDPGDDPFVPIDEDGSPADDPGVS
jgi:hypothetical protein